MVDNGNDTPIFLPGGGVHLTAEQKVRRAEKQIMISAVHIGKLNDQNPLAMALMMVNAAMTIIEGIYSTHPQHARTCYVDCLQSITNFADTTNIAGTAKPVGETVDLSVDKKDTKH